MRFRGKVDFSSKKKEKTHTKATERTKVNEEKEKPSTVLWASNSELFNFYDANADKFINFSII